MQRYVAARGGRPDSPSRPQSANGKRTAAANLKVPVTKTTLRHEPAQQHDSALRHLGSNANHQSTQANHGQRRESGESINGRHDRFGTDAGSSIDTTINGQSFIREDDGQGAQQPEMAYDAAGHGEDEESSGDESGSDEEGDEEGGEKGYTDVSEQDGQYYSELKGYMVKEAMFAEGNSYPSTTSGPPEDFLNNRIAGQQPPFGDDDGHSAHLHIPQQTGNGHASLHTQPVPQRPNHTATASHNMPGQVNLFQKGKAVRDDQRAIANFSVHGAGSQQVNAPVLSNQPSTYMPIGQQAPRPAKVAFHPPPSASAGQIPQLGAAQPSAPPRVTTTKPVRVPPTAPALTAHPAPPLPKEESVIPYQSIEEDPFHEPETPVEDYDTPALYDMDYDLLRDEDFDTVPRGKHDVLPASMQREPLPERLEHVQKHLNATAQDKFFRALPTREWEDAGDWFLEKFGDIITRAKEARQNKRKLAREFEDEVEKRYRHVAKRQQNVEAALEGMKTKGQGLIPRSPRTSKEPAKTPRKHKK